MHSVADVLGVKDRGRVDKVERCRRQAAAAKSACVGCFAAMHARGCSLLRAAPAAVRDACTSETMGIRAMYLVLWCLNLHSKEALKCGRSR